MGTERDTVYECVCMCGRGKFRIDFCSPDHGWPSSTPFWYELFIKCESCNQGYELQQHGHNIVVVEKTEIKRRKGFAEESHKRWKKLLSTPEVTKILKDFITLLDSQRSMAAIHRLLTGEGIEVSGIATFRKRWRGAQEWVDRNVYYFYLPAIMKLVGNKDKDILNEISEIKRLFEDSRSLPPAVGKPIYATTKIA